MENNNAKIDELVEKAMLYLKKLGWDDRFTQHIKNMATKRDAAVIFSKLADKLCEDKNGVNICEFVREVDNISNKDVAKLLVAAYNNPMLGENVSLYSSFKSKIKNLSFADIEQILNDLKMDGTYAGNELIIYIATTVENLSHENKVELMNRLGLDGFHICEFAEKVEGLTHDDLVVLIDKLTRDNLTYVVRFASNVKGLTHDDLVKIMRLLIDSNDINRVIEFASSVDGLTHDDVVVMRDVVIRWGLIKHVNDFAQSAKGLTHDDKVLLMRDLINKNISNNHEYQVDDLSYVLNFAQKVKGLTHEDIVELMRNVIKTSIETGLSKYMAYFILGVSGLTNGDIIELLTGIIKTHDIDQIEYVVENIKGLTDEDYDLIVTLAKDEHIDLSETFKKFYSKAINDSLDNLINKL